MPKPTPKKWSDFSPYLKGEMLGKRAYTLTIKGLSVAITHPRGQDRESPILSFEETDKGLILTPTNRAILAGLFGDDIAASFGRRINLHAEEKIVAGKTCYPIIIKPGPPDKPSHLPPSDKEKSK